MYITAVTASSLLVVSAGSGMQQQQQAVTSAQLAMPLQAPSSEAPLATTPAAQAGQPPCPFCLLHQAASRPAAHSLSTGPPFLPQLHLMLYKHPPPARPQTPYPLACYSSLKASAQRVPSWALLLVSQQTLMAVAVHSSPVYAGSSNSAAATPTRPAMGCTR